MSDRIAPPVKTIRLVVTLAESEAWILAQLFKRLSFSDFLRNAVDEDEAYAMRNAADLVRRGLADAGYAPR
jgi:hypothetical protein